MLAQFDYNALQFDQPDVFNPSVFNANSGQGAPSFDFGMYYYTKNFYAGLSTTHIGGLGIDNVINDTLSSTIEYNQHFMLASGIAIKLNEDMVFKPSTLLKYVPNAPLNVDINASMLFKKVFWFGVSYRIQSAVSIITEYNITDWMRLGYSYDIVLNLSLIHI